MCTRNSLPNIYLSCAQLIETFHDKTCVKGIICKKRLIMPLVHAVQ